VLAGLKAAYRLQACGRLTLLLTLQEVDSAYRVFNHVVELQMAGTTNPCITTLHLS
jgi:hypothetical protein